MINSFNITVNNFIIAVEVMIGDGGWYKYNVIPVFHGVDRPRSFSWNVPESYVDRLAEAVLANRVCVNQEIVFDIYGKTYVRFYSLVFGKNIDLDLSRFGY